MFNFLSLFAASACDKPFLGFKTWHAYLPKNGDCTISRFNLLPINGPSDVPYVVLAVVDSLLRLAGLVAVIFVIYGAIQYVTSQGSPDEASKAQSTIQNALIGLIVAIIAVSVVSFLGRRITQ